VPTFLTTPRMNPALRARVERSVSRGAKARHHTKQLGLGPLFQGRARLGVGRLIPLVALAVVALLVGLARRQDQHDVEEQRAAVLAALEAHRSALPPGHESFLATTEQLVRELATGAYAGDLVAPELLLPGALDGLLARPAVYVRGATPELRDPARLAEAAATSTKDAFLLCLVEPPVSRDERAVLGKIRGVSFGGAMVDAQTANIRRLVEAQVGFAVLGPAFEAEARAAEALAPLQKLAKDLQAAPIEAASRAAAAELLIVVADEAEDAAPKSKTSGTDDPLGYRAQERAHEVRVALVDLTSGRALLRLRRRVDASNRSERATALYRAAIQGCDLALDVRGATDG
jgi:hypothetical protein